MIQNAQEATEDSGSVTISMIVTGNQAVVEIKDTGCGMDDDYIRDSLFRPFKTTKGNAGMGIGVYESREFIASLGGRLDVVSTPNIGTSFYIHLHVQQPGMSSEEAESQLNINVAT